MTPPLFLSSSNDTTQPLSAVLLIYSLFQKIDSESERIFQKAKENIMKGKRIIAVCITPSCHHCNPREHPNTSSTGSSKRHLFPDLPDSKDSLTSHSRGSVVQDQPVGGCFAGPVAPNAVRLIFHLCQSCLVRYNATPSHGGTLPAIIFLSINPIFLWEWLLLSLQPLPYTIGSAGTNTHIFISHTSNSPCHCELV